MLQLGLADVILAEREREIEAAIRRRRLLTPQDGETDVRPSMKRGPTGAPALSARTRPTGG